MLFPMVRYIKTLRMFLCDKIAEEPKSLLVKLPKKKNIIQIFGLWTIVCLFNL